MHGVTTLTAMNFLSCNVIIVSDDQAFHSVSTFLEILLNEAFVAKHEPCLHYVLTFSDQITLVVVNASVIEKDLLVQFTLAGELFKVKYIYVPCS